MLSSPLSLVRISAVWSDSNLCTIPNLPWLYFPPGLIITMSFWEIWAPVGPFFWPFNGSCFVSNRLAEIKYLFRISMNLSKCCCIFTAAAWKPCRISISGPQFNSDRLAPGYIKVAGDISPSSGEMVNGIWLICRITLRMVVVSSWWDRIGSAFLRGMPKADLM